MILAGVATLAAATLCTWAVGEAAARALFGPRHARVAPESRLLLGLSAATLLLEAAGYFLPVRLAAWLLVPPIAAGAVLLARPGSTLRREGVVVATTAASLVLACVPIAIAGRLTAAAMTNDDATFYLAAADRLFDAPWSVDLRDLPDSCLRERLLRGWYWRTGTSNLVAAVTALTRLPGPSATAVVTSLLLVCVPAPALALARRVGAPRRGVSAHVVGALAAASGAALFLGYQHLLGQLAAYSLFPAAAGASFGALRAGGARRTAHAALLLGAGVAHFADGAALLVVVALVGLATCRRARLRALGRLLSMGAATAAVAPFTLARAAMAAHLTVTVRATGPQPFFPQRGWVDRAALDRLTTVLGVDPWPPWPSTSSPPLVSALGWAATGAGVGLAFLALRRVPRGSGLAGLGVATGVGLCAAVALVHTSYILGKGMLAAAAFVVPAVAAGAGLARGRARALAAVYAVGQLATLAELARPSQWLVVDRPEHDRLVPALAALPRGSVLVLDGLGAPSDPVHDAHRAYRAAQLAGLRPIHAGLDGGFYRPRCEDPPRIEPLPDLAYVLARASTEHLSRGRELERLGELSLLEVDLHDPGAIAATWAPTHGVLPAEVEPGRGPFRWSEAASRATLRVLTGGRCARLAGELRTTGPRGLVTLSTAGAATFASYVSAEWTPFTTSPIEVGVERPVELLFERASAPPPDPSHVVALRDLHVVPEPRCGAVLGLHPSPHAIDLPLSLAEPLQLEVVPAAGIACGAVTIRLAMPVGGELGTSIDRGSVHWHALGPDQTELTTDVVSFDRPRALGLSRREGAARPYPIADIRVTPRPCAP